MDGSYGPIRTAAEQSEGGGESNTPVRDEPLQGIETVVKSKAWA